MSVDETDQGFEAAIADLDEDVKNFARVSFYDRMVPLNPHRRQLSSQEVKLAFARIDAFRKACSEKPGV